MHALVVWQSPTDGLQLREEAAADAPVEKPFDIDAPVTEAATCDEATADDVDGVRRGGEGGGDWEAMWIAAGCPMEAAPPPPSSAPIASQVPLCNGRVAIVRESEGSLWEGGRVWPPAAPLATMLDAAEHVSHSELADARVLELGAGCGLVGIATALLGARSVTLSDLPLALPTLNANVAANGLVPRTVGEAAEAYAEGHDARAEQVELEAHQVLPEAGRGVRSPAWSNYSSPIPGLAHAS